MINLITGGAGFLGSHLIDKLMQNKEKVVCVDNFLTGNKSNISNWLDNSNFNLINHDIRKPLDIKADKIWHFGCPASPSKYAKSL